MYDDGKGNEHYNDEHYHETNSEFPIIEKGPGWRTWHFTRRLLITWESKHFWDSVRPEHSWYWGLDGDEDSFYIRILGLEITWLRS